MQRYHSQMMLSEIGSLGQEKLHNSRVLVVGAGGLSATLLPQLVGAGVGYIRLYDKDIVSLENLHRQTLFTIKDIGRTKVNCARKFLKRNNPEVCIDAVENFITSNTINYALKDIDLVIDAADNFDVTYMLSDACEINVIPLISASVMGRQGYVGGFCCNVPSYRVVFPHIQPNNTIRGNCITAGVMGSAVAILGGLEAQMSLSVLLDFIPSPLGCIVICDFVNWHFSQFRFDSIDDDHYINIPFIDRSLLSLNDCIVDLRSYEEAPKSITDHAKRIMPQELSSWNPPKNQRIVLVCSGGIRSSKAARELMKRGFRELAIVVDCIQ